MTYQSMMKLGEVQFINDSPERGLYKSFFENSSDDELFSEKPPYPLGMDIEELISPPETSRTTVKYKKHPDLSNPPRPQNDWVLFRRNFTALLKLNGIKMKNTKISSLAADEWRRQPPKPESHIYMTPDETSSVDNFSEEFNSQEISKTLNDFLLYNGSPNNDCYAKNISLIQQEISDQTDDQETSTQEIDYLFFQFINHDMLD
ncbi:14365_t:CDS:2 [Dentiscutata heterogama]|uniref:14365_t:CDS:1 n=1 Tax=Dentiscutata heterogama TaxID=1316150 RepID=A0ACA9KQS4_9GLOM|nr:14365_t:CDS:2 [Dentiscutata heterogama]